jgi:hypothetical protein
MERNFIQLKNHEGFEITIDEPWQFRHIDSFGKCRIVKPWLNRKIGYYFVDFNNKHYLLHRLVAEQFLDNPNDFPQVDHINRIRTDNRIENLRFVSNSLNQRNSTSHQGVQYEFLDELPDGYMPFTEYVMKNGTTHKFNNLFIKFEKGIPQFITNDSLHQFRKLHQHKDKNDVSHRDIEGKRCHICFSRINKPISTTTTTTETTTITTAEETRTTTKTTTTTTKYQSEPEEDHSKEEPEHYEPDEDYRK